MKKIIFMLTTIVVAAMAAPSIPATPMAFGDMEISAKEIKYVRCEKGIVPAAAYDEELHGEKREEIVYYRPSITFPAMTEENFHHFYRVYMSGMMKLQFAKAKSENLEGEEK